jgi:hypothetical protein
MFKKTILAVATVAAFGVAGANAASVTSTAVKYSAEGNAKATSYATNSVVVELSADYQVGDTVTFTFGADFLVPTGGFVAPSLGTDLTGFTLGYLSADANSITYRVTNTASTSTVGKKLTLGSVNLEDSSVEAAGKVSVTYSAATNTGVVIDNAATNVAKDIVQVVDELKTTVAAAGKLDGVIDVSADRYSFEPATSGGAAVTSDKLTITNTLATGLDTSTDLDVSKVVYTVKGDFSWIADNDKDTAGIQSTVVSSNATGATVKYAADAITVESTALDTSVDITFETANNGTAGNKAMLPAGDFTVDAVVTHTAGVDSDAAGLAAGSWSLNGATRTIQAYPISSNVQNFVWVTNDGSVAGGISATATAGGKSWGPYDLGSVAAKSLLSLGGTLNAALAADGVTSGRVQVVLTINAPDSDIDVNASYKVVSDADRLSLSVEGN